MKNEELPRPVLRTVTANEMALEECKRITRGFAQEAIREWDLRGEGCFQVWVRGFVARRWLMLLMSN